MIIGLGTDVVNIDRIKELIEEFGIRFINKTFTESEIKDSEKFPKDNKLQIASFFAKRYAAKEACAKALGTGFINGLSLQHIEVSNNSLGKPEIILKKNALETLRSLSEKNININVSLSDDYPIAIATVIIS